MRLAGKVAVVTGAAQGVGHAIAQRLGEIGMSKRLEVRIVLVSGGGSGIGAATAGRSAVLVTAL
ncbi:MAG: hypothetical protein LBJ15_02680 [Comamonas sp.]|jgi:NAD(P)-dependent dehydrogenase (short-subunit alcohol dehydrogenase family)|uniref:hypothetical protein n=1 Tax=Comamonas sp. TaxID=34028 RepID=UPI002832A87E|nr:hypothetical protein [Comamonas sp.]MDR0212892.1 hypothetical protein [Comamonas sp.]